MSVCRTVYLAALAVAAAIPANGDEPPRPASPRGAIEARYRDELARISRERIESLTRLAATQKGAEAEQTYLEILRFAVATDRYADAEPAATRVVESTPAGTPPASEVDVLSRLVKILAEADRGDLDASMRDLRAALASTPAPTTPRLRSQTTLSLSEAYFRRLLRGGRFDLASQVCDLVKSTPDLNPAVRDHFAAYARRLALVGKPAPEIAGVDADGARVALADTKGKVVLVVFWATWCPPCAEGVPLLAQVVHRYEKEGFTVLGVNLDTGSDRAKAVRRFLVDFGVAWPNVLAGDAPAGRDLAATYGVTEIPASVLVGRDGRVATFDLAGDDLSDAVAAALGKTPAAP